MTMKLVDRFTTRDGEWDAGMLKPFGIDPAKLKQYIGQDIPGRGGAVHIFVKAPIGSVVKFNTTDGRNLVTLPVTAENKGWVNHAMTRDAHYDPGKGQKGPWLVWVNNVPIITAAEGIGLPNWQHVSTFLVVEDVADEVTIPDAPTPPPAQGSIVHQALIRTFVNGELIEERVVWQS